MLYCEIVTPSMSKIAKTSIDVAKLVAPIVGSRDVVDLLRAALKKTHAKSVDLDFCDVEFVSRSAAHELLSMKNELARQLIAKQDVAFVNMRDEVRDMFRVVAANIAAPKITSSTIRMKSVSINSLMSDDKKRAEA
jgi:hypothetical protein